MQSQFEKYKHIKSVISGRNVEKHPQKYCFLIPTYKRPELLQRALKSIFSQKGTLEYNVIVVDNDNTKGTETENIIWEFQKSKSNLYYYKNEENIGLFGNWNRCYQLAFGEYCCILMDDDEVCPDYLNRVDTVLEEVDLDCLRVGSYILDEKDCRIREKNFLDRRYLNRPNHLEHISWKYFLFRGALPPSGMCIKKSVMMELGGYDENYWPGSDFEFDTRLVQKYKVALLWERLCITHTEVSTSKLEKTVSKSISQGLVLYKKTYNDVFNKSGRYDWIAEVRTWIAIEKAGCRKEQLDYMKLNDLYNTRIFKFFYKSLYYMHRIIQTWER